MTSPDTVYISYIAATPEQVWQALTDGDFTQQYFFGRRVESDWREGSTWTMYLDDGRVDSNGVVRRSEPPRLLEFTFHVEWLEEYRSLPDAVVTYTIEPLGEVVRLTMAESHPEPIDEKYLEGGRQGWPAILSGLKTLVESGRPLPPFAFDPPEEPPTAG